MSWGAGRPRVLVADAWLSNAGDGAISLGTNARLRRLAPEAAVLHAAYQADLVGDAYPSLDFVPPLDGLLGVVPGIPELDGWTPEQAAAVVADADVVLSQGGGFAMEHYDTWPQLRAWELLVERGTPLAFAAQSVGPWRAARERAMLGRAYRAAVAIAVRDSDSARNVIELGADPARLVETADEVFELFDRPPSPPAREPRGVAAVLTEHSVAAADGAVAPAEHLSQRLLVLLARLVELTGDEGVTLFSTQQGLGALGRGLEDDSELAERLRAGLAPGVAERVAVVEGYLTPESFADHVSGHRALLTMRMHPAIIGLSRGVPAVLVSRGFKAAGVFNRAGLDGIVCGELDPDAVTGRVRAALAADAPRGAALWERLAEARRRSAANDLVVERLLAAAG
jgi:polysaccharide pyruvyl transferase WcaK-like protein